MVDEPGGAGNKIKACSPRKPSERGTAVLFRLCSYGAVGGIEVTIDDFFGRLFALTAAVRDRKAALNFVQ